MLQVSTLFWIVRVFMKHATQARPGKSVEDSLKELDSPNARTSSTTSSALDIGYNKDFDPFEGLTVAIRTINSSSRNLVDESESSDDEYENSAILDQVESASLLEGTEAQSIRQVISLKGAYSNLQSSQRRSMLGSWPRTAWEPQEVGILG